MVHQVRTTMLLLKIWWRANVLYGRAVTRNPWKNLFNYPLSTQYFSPDPPAPQPHFKAPNATVSSATSPKPPAPHIQTRNGPFFVHWKKESHRIKRSKIFNYNIIYTISMTIVTIGDKIVERIFESSDGALFWNQWKNSGPCQPMEATELLN